MDYSRYRDLFNFVVKLAAVTKVDQHGKAKSCQIPFEFLVVQTKAGTNRPTTP